MNLAHEFVASLGKDVAGTREEYDGACIDFAGDMIDGWLKRCRLAYFDNLAHSRWRYHAAVEVDGMIHDLWSDEPMPLKKFMSMIGAETVEYPAEETEPA